MGMCPDDGGNQAVQIVAGGDFSLVVSACMSTKITRTPFSSLSLLASASEMRKGFSSGG